MTKCFCTNDPQEEIIDCDESVSLLENISGKKVEREDKHKFFLMLRDNFLDTVMKCERGEIAPRYKKLLDSKGYNMQDIFQIIQHPEYKTHHAHLLGIFYEYGIGTRIDYEKAFESYKTAAENNDIPSFVSLGNLYSEGSGVGLNVAATKGIKFYERGAKQGNNDAICKLGHCHMAGVGFPKNDRKGRLFFERASSNGHSHAQYSLGFCYRYGRGVVEDMHYALKLFSRADSDEAMEEFLDAFRYDEIF
ncbi:6154_t:CDS:2 [Ambispora gerdemannii]|uniref:6154_t:CDS:1 n=1 Tax=Ambispora gerdemannii TaxID=144530 RepID=A0A9N8WKV7_9GLOM|nr:6154_t:CDS:2 [Ambispora gerdemannii]